MIIPEAIERQETELHDNPTLDDPELRQAMFLGIEALKRIKKSRQDASRYYIGYLPGETEEEGKDNGSKVT